jgi:hypothetical protein
VAMHRRADALMLFVAQPDSRTMFTQAPAEEFEVFGDLLLNAGERRRDLTAALVDWARQCDGDFDNIDCPVHASVRAADEFVHLIDND